MQFENLKKAVENKLLERATKDWQDFIEDDGSIWIDKECVTETAFDLVYEGSEEERDTVLESVEASLSEVFEEMLLTIQEQAEEAREWYMAQSSAGDMLRYHGLSYADFA